MGSKSKDAETIISTQTATASGLKLSGQALLLTTLIED